MDLCFDEEFGVDFVHYQPTNFTITITIVACYYIAVIFLTEQKKINRFLKETINSKQMLAALAHVYYIKNDNCSQC